MDAGKIIKGSLSVVVLQLLANNGSMYGYEIVKAVKDASKGHTEITEAALYPTLHRLTTNGLLTVSHKTIEGRERKYYKLSRQGNKQAEAALQELQNALLSLQRILKFQKKD